MLVKAQKLTTLQLLPWQKPTFPLGFRDAKGGAPFWQGSATVGKPEGKAYQAQLSLRKRLTTELRYTFPKLSVPVLLWLCPTFPLTRLKSWLLFRKWGVCLPNPNLIRSEWNSWDLALPQTLKKKGTTDWFHIGKGIRQGCILSPCLFNLYAEYIMRNAGLEEAQLESRLLGEISITSDMQMTPHLRQKVKRS